MISFLELDQKFLNNHDISDEGIAALIQAMKPQKIFHVASESLDIAFRHLVKEKDRQLVILSQMDFDVIISPAQRALFKSLENETGLPFAGILGVRPNEHEATSRATLEM